MTCCNVTFISTSIIKFYSTYFAFEKTVFHYLCCVLYIFVVTSRLLTILDHYVTFLFFLPSGSDFDPASCRGPIYAEGSHSRSFFTSRACQECDWLCTNDKSSPMQPQAIQC